LGDAQLPAHDKGVPNAVLCIYKDRQGTLWVGANSGLHKINITATKAGQPSRVSTTSYKNDPANSNSLSSNTVGEMFEDKAGILWLATDNGLNSFDRKTGIFKRFQKNAKNIHSISSNNLVPFPGGGIGEDHEGNLWICTDKGLNKLNRNRAVFTHYFHDPDDTYSLSSNNIISLAIDREGVLWAGAWPGKLNKAVLNKKAFSLSRHDPNNVNSLSNNEVTSIWEDSSGIIWIGTHGGLNRWDKKNNQYTRYYHDPSNPTTLRSSVIHALLEDRHKHLWIANGNTLSRLNKQTGEFRHYASSMASNLKAHDNPTISSITEDRQGLLWLGLMGNGIQSFDEKTGAFVNYYYNPVDSNGISDYVATNVFADKKDYIWIGHMSIATDRLNKQTGSFTRYKHDSRDSTSISSNIVYSFYEDAKGNLWFGTLSGGLCRFNYEKERFTTLTDKHGLPSSTVYSILEDNKDNLWLGTWDGLTRFEPITKTFTNYNYKDGLQSNSFTAANLTEKGACFKGRDGTLYFGGGNGFNFFNPDDLKVNSYVAPVVITQFKLFDTLVKGATESKEIVLNYDQNYFSFEFSSLSYSNPTKIQYAYKLQGVDNDWCIPGQDVM
jgi:ligand-binding sensor domain-containing protein